MDTKRLEELHDIVKQHPYRLRSFDDHLRKSYHDALDSLSDEFNIHIKEYRNDKFKDMRWNFMHEFNTLILYLSYHQLLGDQNAALDSCIAQIHRFLDTGKWTYVQTYYDGSNFDQKLGRWREWVYDDTLDKFVVPIEKADVYLDYYKRKIESYEKEKIDKPNDWSDNKQSILEYYINEQKELNERKFSHHQSMQNQK
jgi:hypothetical protein